MPTEPSNTDIISKPQAPNAGTGGGFARFSKAIENPFQFSAVRLVQVTLENVPVSWITP